MSRDRIASVLYGTGTLIIILSWTDTVSPRVGWMGFLVALAGSMISWRGQRPAATRPASPPSPRTSLFERADRLASRRQYAEAEAVYHEALLANPRDTDALLGIAACRSAQGDGDDAATCYRRALEADPASVAARVGLGDLAVERADYRGAEKEYRQALAVTPDAVEALRGLALVRDKLGDRAEAIAHLERIAAILPGSDLARESRAWIAEIRSRP